MATRRTRNTAFGAGTMKAIEQHVGPVRRMHWKTGFPPESLAPVLSGYGLSLLDDAGPAEYEQRYLAPRHRTLPVFEIERCAVAAAGDRPL